VLGIGGGCVTIIGCRVTMKRYVSGAFAGLITRRVRFFGG
jgi:hypothetical protein